MSAREIPTKKDYIKQNSSKDGEKRQDRNNIEGEIPQDFLREYEIAVKSGLRGEEDYSTYAQNVLSVKDLFSQKEFIDDLKEALQVSKALDNEVRMKILSFLLIRHESCLCELSVILNIDASTLTYHVNLLKEAGIVRMTRKGRSKIVALEHDYHFMVPVKVLLLLKPYIDLLRENLKQACTSCE